ncbi:MAG: hypothetical protein M1436_03915 [Acidobacteria bacterium]|nr:hypothetical protein [Acidobacteriota bacterium]
MGKLTAIAVTALLVVAVTMVSAWGNETVHLAGLGIIVVIVFAVFRRIAKTLEASPEVAILEGAEFIRYRQLEIAAKNIPAIPLTPAIPDPVPPPMQAIEGPTEEEEG